MVVVAIIGVLTAISSVNYESYQRRSKQAEAKIGLSSIYALQKSFYSEYSAYVPSFNAIGFSVEGAKAYYAKEVCVSGPWSGSVTGYSGTYTSQAIIAVGVPWALSRNPAGTTCVNGVTYSPTCGSMGNDPQSYRIGMYTNFCPTCTADLWSIDEFKRLINCASGI